LGVDAREVTLDPNYRVPRWTPEYRAEAALLAPYWAALTKESDNHLDAAVADLARAIDQVPARDTVGARFLLEEGMARLLAGDGKRLDEARIHAERSLMSASRRIDRLAWTFYLLGYIASAANDTATVRRAIIGAEAADAVVGSWSRWGRATGALLPLGDRR
jgi:hypothetical protein